MPNYRTFLLSIISGLISHFAVLSAFAAVPGTPINPAVRGIDATTVEFSWSVNAIDVNNVSGFTPGNKRGSRMYSDPAMRSIQMPACPGVSDNYTVSAWNASGSSPATAPVSFTLPDQKPVMPSYSTFSAYPLTVTEIRFSFGAFPCNVGGVKIERAVGTATTPPQSSAYVEILSLPFANAGGASDKNVSPGVYYYYRMRPYSVTGILGDYMPPAMTVIALSTPVWTAVRFASATQVSLGWESNTQQLVDSNLVERKAGAAGAWQQIATIPTVTRTYIDNPPGQNTYFYRVRTFSNVIGHSAYSNEVQMDFFAPSAPPQNFTAIPNPPEPTGWVAIKLAWTALPLNSQGIIIERRDTSAGTFNEIFRTGPHMDAINNVDYYDLAINTNQLYSYRAKQFNAFGESTFTPIVSATYSTGVTPLLPPNNVRVIP